MAPLLGRPLTDIHLRRRRRPEAAARGSSSSCMQTEITQPAVLTVDLALTRLLGAYGMRPTW